MTYRDQYTKTVTYMGQEYVLKSKDGCFWDVWVNGELIAKDYTNYNNAFAAVKNGEIKEYFLDMQ